jgi:hypothetical protein
MNPIIANANGQARYNELLQEAAEYRQQTKVSRRLPSFITAIINLFI